MKTKSTATLPLRRFPHLYACVRDKSRARTIARSLLVIDARVCVDERVRAQRSQWNGGKNEEQTSSQWQASATITKQCLCASARARAYDTTQTREAKKERNTKNKNERLFVENKSFVAEWFILICMLTGSRHFSNILNSILLCPCIHGCVCVCSSSLCERARIQIGDFSTASISKHRFFGFDFSIRFSNEKPLPIPGDLQAHTHRACPTYVLALWCALDCVGLWIRCVHKNAGIVSKQQRSVRVCVGAGKMEHKHVWRKSRLRSMAGRKNVLISTTIHNISLPFRYGVAVDLDMCIRSALCRVLHSMIAHSFRQQ